MNSNSRITGTVAILMVVLALGCQSSGRVKIDPMPVRSQYSEPVNFEQDLQVPSTPSLRNPNDPHDVVLFALSLSRLGRHAHAAEFLEEAAARFSSRDQEFEIAARSGACSEFLKAGNMEKFRNCVRELRQTANRYQHAAFDENVLALLALGDIAAGNVAPTELTPKPLKPLFNDGR
jgi:hypothetical protein